MTVISHAGATAVGYWAVLAALLYGITRLTSAIQRRFGRRSDQECPTDDLVQLVAERRRINDAAMADSSFHLREVDTT